MYWLNKFQEGGQISKVKQQLLAVIQQASKELQSGKPGQGVQALAQIMQDQQGSALLDQLAQEMPEVGQFLEMIQQAISGTASAKNGAKLLVSKYHHEIPEPQKNKTGGCACKNHKILMKIGGKLQNVEVDCEGNIVYKCGGKVKKTKKCETGSQIPEQKCGGAAKKCETGSRIPEEKCGGKAKKTKKCETGSQILEEKCGGKTKKTKKCEFGGRLSIDFSKIDFAKCGKKLKKKEEGGEIPADKCGGKAKKHLYGGYLDFSKISFNKCGGKAKKVKKGEGGIQLQTDDGVWNSKLFNRNYVGNAKQAGSAGTVGEKHYYLGNDNKWYTQSVGENSQWGNASEVQFDDADFANWRNGVSSQPGTAPTGGHNIFAEGFNYDATKGTGTFADEASALKAGYTRDQIYDGPAPKSMMGVYGQRGSSLLGTTTTDPTSSREAFINAAGGINNAANAATEYALYAKEANRNAMRAANKQSWKLNGASSQGIKERWLNRQNWRNANKINRATANDLRNKALNSQTISGNVDVTQLNPAGSVSTTPIYSGSTISTPNYYVAKFNTEQQNGNAAK